ncbi:hypothetical protein SAMN04490207_1942 [Pseudomonas gessardii]|uniref:hypothetical protein n=1 Tax=Pseudomonas gessardii TaxID=78544 RepID=UPI000885CA14|nr:hypothetical protein [Pseudomonas gessardii]SDQ79343.1 hypothetical protein SAMN04490207_1942 [Pseudomonas gessardii]
MDATTIALWIKSLGRPYESLVSEGIIPNMPLRELYKGRNWLDIEPEEGMELSFSAESKCLEALYCSGQLIPDTSIGGFDAIARS